MFDQSHGHENPGMRINYFLVKISLRLRRRFRSPHVLSMHLRSKNWMLVNYPKVYIFILQVKFSTSEFVRKLPLYLVQINNPFTLAG